MGHDHSDHDHHHHGGAGRPFAIGIALNLAFVVVQAAYGFVAHSVSLLADAAHNFGDVLGLALAGTAALLARRPSSSRRTYGLRRSTILAALANAVVLLVSVGAVATEAVERLHVPAAVDGKTVMIVAAIGIAINGGSALLFAKGRKGDVNVRAAFLHLLSDAAVSLGVVVAGFVVLRTGWTWVDPVASLVIAAVILLSTFSILKESLNLALDAVPPGIDPDAVRAHLGAAPGVVEVHDLHIWAMSTTETALTAHLVMRGAASPALIDELGRELSHRFHIQHTTLQVEPADAQVGCARC